MPTTTPRRRAAWTTCAAGWAATTSRRSTSSGAPSIRRSPPSWPERSMTLVRNDDGLLPLRLGRRRADRGRPVDARRSDAGRHVVDGDADAGIGASPPLRRRRGDPAAGGAGRGRHRGPGRAARRLRPGRRRDVRRAPPAGAGGAGRRRSWRPASRPSPSPCGRRGTCWPIRPPGPTSAATASCRRRWRRWRPRCSGEAPFAGPVAGRDRRPASARSRARRHGAERRDPGAAGRRPAAARRCAGGVRARSPPRCASRRPRFAVIAARGTSDNAGIYAQYLLAIRNGLIVALAAPSAITLYGARPDMADALVVGISQSGRSPDIVAVLEEARRQGALTVALTNDPDSPLADDRRPRGRPSRRTRAGDGRDEDLHDRAARGGAAVDGARPAIGRRDGRPRRPARADLGGARGGVARARAGRRARRPPACRRARPRLQLRERSRVGAQAAGDGAGRRMPYSAADFEHGPLALAEPGLPVLAVAPSGPELDAQVALLRRLKADHGARLLVISDARGGARDRRGACPAGRHPALAGADRRDRAGAAVRLSPDRRARPRSRASAHDQQGHRDAVSRLNQRALSFGVRRWVS